MNVKYDSLLGQLRETDTSATVFHFKNAAGLESYRLIIRSDILCLDKTLTGTGFAGSENTDWININSFE